MGQVSVELLADRPDLIAALATIRWKEWGDEPGREEADWWVQDLAGERCLVTGAASITTQSHPMVAEIT